MNVVPVDAPEGDLVDGGACVRTAGKSQMIAIAADDAHVGKNHLP